MRARNLLQSLVQPGQYVGDVYSLGYEKAFVQIHDHHRRRVGGIPSLCFLVAARQSDWPEDTDHKREDSSVILLRVMDAAALIGWRYAKGTPNLNNGDVWLGDSTDLLNRASSWQQSKKRKSFFSQSAEMMSRSGHVYVRTDARQRTFEITRNALREAFPNWVEVIVKRPYTKHTQTALYGDKSTKPGEVDVILKGPTATF